MVCDITLRLKKTRSSDYETHGKSQAELIITKVQKPEKNQRGICKLEN